MRHLESVHFFADPSGLGSYCLESGQFVFAGQLTRLAVVKLQTCPKVNDNPRRIPLVPVVDLDELSSFEENTSVLSRFSTSGATPRAGLVLAIPKYGGESARTLSNKLDYLRLPSNPLPFTGHHSAQSKLFLCTGKKASKDLANLCLSKGTYAFPLHFILNSPSVVKVEFRKAWCPAYLQKITNFSFLFPLSEKAVFFCSTESPSIIKTKIELSNARIVEQGLPPLISSLTSQDGHFVFFESPPFPSGPRLR